MSCNKVVRNISRVWRMVAMAVAVVALPMRGEEVDRPVVAVQEAAPKDMTPVFAAPKDEAPVVAAYNVMTPVVAAPNFVAGGAGLVLTSMGAISRASLKNDFSSAAVGGSSDKVTDYLRFAPVIFPWVLKLSGEPVRSGWGRMAVSQSASGILTAGVGYGIKHAVDARRPDGSDLNSFPSGHSAIAFMGATMVAHELGWRSPWYTLGAYAFATGIAAERVIGNHHFPADVVAGAGIGILATEAGYYLGDLIFGDRQIDRRYHGGELERANGNYSSLSIATGLMIPLGGRVRCGGVALSRQAALSSALRGHWAIDDRWGLAVEGGLLSMPLMMDGAGGRTYVKSLSSIDLLLLPAYTHLCSSRLSLSVEAGGGYRFNLPLSAIDRAVEADSGTPVGRVGVGIGLRLSDHFTSRANIGYEISHYNFKVRPSESYHIPAAAESKGVTSALQLSISSCYEF